MIYKGFFFFNLNNQRLTTNVIQYYRSLSWCKRHTTQTFSIAVKLSNYTYEILTYRKATFVYFKCTFVICIVLDTNGQDMFQSVDRLFLICNRLHIKAALVHRESFNGSITNLLRFIALWYRNTEQANLNYVMSF